MKNLPKAGLTDCQLKDSQDMIRKSNSKCFPHTGSHGCSRAEHSYRASTVSIWVLIQTTSYNPWKPESLDSHVAEETQRAGSLRKAFLLSGFISASLTEPKTQDTVLLYRHCGLPEGRKKAEKEKVCSRPGERLVGPHPPLCCLPGFLRHEAVKPALGVLLKRS